MPEILMTQEQATEALLERMQEYLDLRYTQCVRVNPRLENVWPDLAWQCLEQMRILLESTKAWGPIRYGVSVVLLSDDTAKIRDLFSLSHQNGMLAEVIEGEDDKKAHASAKGSVPITDMRGFYSALEPSVASIVKLMQVFLWWDFEDCVDLARFDAKMALFAAFRRGEVTRDHINHFRRAMGLKSDAPDATPDEIVDYELDQLGRIVGRFAARRQGEAGYKLIIARRKTSAVDQMDKLIGTIAQEQSLIGTLEMGKDVSEGMKAQFARVLKVPVEALNREMEREFLERQVAEHKRQLRTTVVDQAGGIPYNFKALQAEVIMRKFEMLRAGIEEERAKEGKEAPKATIMLSSEEVAKPEEGGMKEPPGFGGGTGLL